VARVAVAAAPDVRAVGVEPREHPVKKTDGRLSATNREKAQAVVERS
jgi:hypothetical protein